MVDMGHGYNSMARFVVLGSRSGQSPESLKEARSRSYSAGTLSGTGRGCEHRHLGQCRTEFGNHNSNSRYTF
jgi:hypothetical protein